MAGTDIRIHVFCIAMELQGGMVILQKLLNLVYFRPVTFPHFNSHIISTTLFFCQDVCGNCSLVYQSRSVYSMT